MDDTQQHALSEGNRVDGLVKYITEALKMYEGEITYETAMLACTIMAAVGAANMEMPRSKFLAICGKAYDHHLQAKPPIN